MKKTTRYCGGHFKGAAVLSFATLLALSLSGCGAGQTAANDAPGSPETPSASEQTLAQELYGNMRSFSTTTFDGENFTQDNLKDYDLTMVNIWQTNCHYCIEEMPGLELLYQNLPDNVNMVGVCIDGDTNRELADQILSQAGATFPVLLDSESLHQNLVGNVIGVPTTVFVDKDGQIIGQPQVGMPTKGGDEGVAQTYMDYIEYCLGLLE